jgi:hypothetical protein
MNPLPCGHMTSHICNESTINALEEIEELYNYITIDDIISMKGDYYINCCGKTVEQSLQIILNYITYALNKGTLKPIDEFNNEYQLLIYIKESLERFK